MSDTPRKKTTERAAKHAAKLRQERIETCRRRRAFLEDVRRFLNKGESK